MKKGDIIKKKYSKLWGMSPQIALECNADPDYVRKVLSGRTLPKTDRATKILNIYSIADRILKALNNQNN